MWRRTSSAHDRSHLRSSGRALSLSIVMSRASVGIEAPPVRVEVHITGGLPKFAIVGLPEATVRESKDRVRSAIINSRFEFPRRRITVSLAPADLPKDGSRYDLPIAIGILAATGQLCQDRFGEHELIGELALDGALRRTGGSLPAALHARDAGRILVIAGDDAHEARLAAGARLFPAHSLGEAHAQLIGDSSPEPAEAAPPAGTPTAEDLQDVRRQFTARRALELAAAGNHNLLMLGPPGTGKTMLATRLPGILPPMTEEEALESAMVRSVSALGFDARDWGVPPFRAPHHSASPAAIVGGGAVPSPGEISLAHHGVLFLDELPEFSRLVLEALREPLESGSVTISRASRQASFPARFQLVAAMNPCPCGTLGDPAGTCRCTPEQVARYRARISGPLLDRIDLHVEVPRIRDDGDSGLAESSAAVRERVARARAVQIARAVKPNQGLSVSEIGKHCSLAPGSRRLLSRAMEKLHLSARARDRVLRVARTIADLARCERIDDAHVAEAISFRTLDRGAGRGFE